MNPPQPPSVAPNGDGGQSAKQSRTKSFSQSSDDSQTAADFIDKQLRLEADAREALPYKFDTCTRPLGPLRQLLFACITCNPPPATPSQPYTPAAVCYSCSVQCHGEHTLVELFNKRNFVCDCGTTQMPINSPCTLRINSVANQKGGVVSEPAEDKNRYNHNFQNRFCGCLCDYDAHQQKGTMFQCLGLGTVEEGGCGEDWYHTGCIVGLGPDWHDRDTHGSKISEAPQGHISDESSNEDDVPHAPGFPDEDEFDGFICYKCVDANPWIKRYAGTQGFLPPVFKRSLAPSPEADPGLYCDPTKTKNVADIFKNSTISTQQEGKETNTNDKEHTATPPKQKTNPIELKTASDVFDLPLAISKKRKSSEADEDESASTKRFKEDNHYLNDEAVSTEMTGTLDKLTSSELKVKPICKYEQLPKASEGTMSLFYRSDFRDHLCRCRDCFPRMAKHPQLLEEEDTYEPPVSEEGDDGEGSTVGSGSLLDRGERALTNVDRVRAIEGVMAYNHLKEKLKPFFKEFAESGKAISAEDIKAHFAKIRGDEEAIRQAGEAAANSNDNRREESGY